MGPLETANAPVVPSGLGDAGDGDPPAGAQHAAALPEDDRDLRCVEQLEREPEEDRVHRAVRAGQARRIAAHQQHAPFESTPLEATAALPQHAV